LTIMAFNRRSCPKVFQPRTKRRIYTLASNGETELAGWDLHPLENPHLSTSRNINST
jgi:hypothetical protein